MLAKSVALSILSGCTVWIA